MRGRWVEWDTAGSNGCRAHLTTYGQVTWCGRIINPVTVKDAGPETIRCSLCKRTNRYKRTAT